MQRLLIGVLTVALIISIIGNILVFNRYSTSRPLVTIGNEAISKKDYQDLLEYQDGSAALKKLVYSNLIKQAATQAGLMPTTADVEQRITDIRRRTPQMLTEAERDPGKMQDLKANLLSDIALENLRIKDIKASDADVAAFYMANRSSFALPGQVQTTMVVTANSTDAQTALSLLQAGMRDDVIARQPRMHVAGVAGFNIDMDRISAADKKTISAAVFTMKPGDIRVVPVTGAFLIFKIKKSESTYIPPLSEIRPLAIRAYKLQKSPSASYVMASLYHTMHPQFQIDRYESYFNDIRNVDMKTATAAEKAAGHLK